MGEINLYRVEGKEVDEIETKVVELEKKVQNLIEDNLEELLAISFLSTEFSTSARHGGRIDTLGIDENNVPVIIEYKKHTDQNVINQGLFYLDWLMDHRAAFERLVREETTNKRAEKIEWDGPRLICIAPDFTKYDSHAVEQIDQNIELMRFKQYDDDILLLELVNIGEPGDVETGVSREYKGVKDYHDQASEQLIQLFQDLEDFIFNLGDDVKKRELEYYYAYKRSQNFVCLEFKPNDDRLLLHLKLDPKKMDEMPEIARDVTDVGHYGTGDLELNIRSEEDFDIAKPLMERSYEGVGQ